jgi:DNA mismatch repair protein MutL
MLRILGQILNSYIVAEGPEGLYLIDQHAAHERILLEKIKTQKSREGIEVQGLLEGVALDVNPRQVEVLETCYEDLADFGFSIEPFGDRTYIVRAIPQLLHNKNWISMLRQLLDSSPGVDKANWLESIAVSLACHSAIRAGQTLTDNEMRELVRQLEQTTVPNTCPHGRPTLIHLSSGQLEREFGRG